MIPDKIYVPQHNIDAGTIQELCEWIVEGSVEYIRKDVLLEWAEDWQNELDDSLGASMVHHVLNEVIEKIESL